MVFFGCTTRAPVADPQPAPPPPQAAAPEPAAAEPPVAFVATAAVEPGFVHCCGTLDIKMEVECGDRLKRCYVREDGEWKQTYGRHCKSALGSACYLHMCDDACDAQ